MAKSKYDEFKLGGRKMVKRAKQLVHEGNIRRITVKNRKGDSLVEVPLTLGVLGAVLLPTLTAIGAITAVVTESSIGVKRVK